MKNIRLPLLPAVLLMCSPLLAQNPESAQGIPPALPPAGGAPEPLPPVAVPTAPVQPEPVQPQEPVALPDAAEDQEIGKSDQGFIIKNANLNDIFQFLAKSAGRQYFHNNQISGQEYLVTGHLNDGNPLQQMEELAFMFGLSLHVKGNTIYALTQVQLAQLPGSEFHYQLRYLRPTDMDQIKELIKPILSPGTGIVNFEPKTNTIVIIDTAHRIEQARELLHKVDQVKGQIIVETKILRVNSTAAERVGVNWSNSLGATGTDLSVARDLNSVFGLPSPPAAAIPDADGTNLVLSPLQLTGVLRALAEGNIANQIANPTLITEDNEQASISIIDRVPIITSTSTVSSGGPAQITEEVRYKIDGSDKTIDEDPENHREIGISLTVTPTLLPDGTIRMKMRPRSAQIVEQIVSTTGNVYPRVTESMVESLARVPNGHSLVVGGFYGQADKRERTKVPLLGDVPVLNFFFKSKETVREQASLVFVVTPKSYNPSNMRETRNAYSQVRSSATLECDADWVDPYNPGPAHEPNMARTLRGLKPHQAPLYPERANAFIPADATGQPASTKPRFGRGSRR
jgi:type II secretory pathway component GspD/PulD (secretin)